KTLGSQCFLDLLEGPLQAPSQHAVRASRDRGADHRGRRFVGDAKLDPDAVPPLGEGEPALLLDEARLRGPADLASPPPAVEAEDVLERQAEGKHLDVEAGPESLRLRTYGFPAVDAFENLG